MTKLLPERLVLCWKWSICMDLHSAFLLLKDESCLVQDWNNVCRTEIYSQIKETLSVYTVIVCFNQTCLFLYSYSSHCVHMENIFYSPWVAEVTFNHRWLLATVMSWSFLHFFKASFFSCNLKWYKMSHLEATLCKN